MRPQAPWAEDRTQDVIFTGFCPKITMLQSQNISASLH